jgi:hypothetical protein
MRIRSEISIIEHLITWRLTWTGRVARMEENKSAFKILAGEPTEKRPLGRPRRTCEHNIRIDLREKINRQTYRKETFRKA